MTDDTREAAAAAISLLREKGWSKGAAKSPDGSICMAVALCGGKEFATGAADYSACARHSIRAVILIDRLFPGRLPRMRIADFNDHPDTTREDVLLVLKHMTEGE